MHRALSGMARVEDLWSVRAAVDMRVYSTNGIQLRLLNPHPASAILHEAASVTVCQRGKTFIFISPY